MVEGISLHTEKGGFMYSKGSVRAVFNYLYIFSAEVHVWGGCGTPTYMSSSSVCWLVVDVTFRRI